MRCPQCQGENEADAKFCEECGNVLARVCASCGRELKPKAKFCPACGSHVDTTPPEPIAAPAPPAPTLAPIHAPDGERRQLTVLFCDLVGSTDIASRLDPEEFSEIAAQYQRTAAEAVIRFGGHVAKYLGDGLVVYFG